MTQQKLFAFFRKLYKALLLLSETLQYSVKIQDMAQAQITKFHNNQYNSATHMQQHCKIWQNCATTQKLCALTKCNDITQVVSLAKTKAPQIQQNCPTTQIKLNNNYAQRSSSKINKVQHEQTKIINTPQTSTKLRKQFATTRRTCSNTMLQRTKTQQHLCTV